MIPSDFSSSIESNLTRSFGAGSTEPQTSAQQEFANKYFGTPEAIGSGLYYGTPDEFLSETGTERGAAGLVGFTLPDGSSVTIVYPRPEKTDYEAGIAGTPQVFPSQPSGYAGSGNYPSQPEDPCKANPASKGYGPVYSKPYANEVVGCTIFSRNEDYKRRVCDGAEILVKSAYRTGETSKSTEAGCQPKPSTGGSTGGGGGSRGGGGGGGTPPPANEQNYGGSIDFSACIPTADGRYLCNASNTQSGSVTGVVPYDPFSPSAKQSWTTDFNPSGYDANDPIMGGSYYAPSGGSPQAFTGNAASDIGIAYQGQQQNYNTFAGAWGGSTGSTWAGTTAGMTSPATTSPLVSAGSQNDITSVRQSGSIEATDATDTNPEGKSLAWITGAIVALKLLAA